MKKGYTLIEVLIVIVIALIFLAILAGAIGSCGRGCIPAGGQAEQEALQWAQKMGLQPIGVDCTTRDTDGDGYVSCTVATGDKRVVAIECAHWLSLNGGCRVPKIGLQRQALPQ